MRELALLALLTVAPLVKDTEHRLGVDAKRHLLDLGGLVEEEVGLAFGILGGLLLPLFRRLFCLFALLVGGATRLHRRCQSGNFSLRGTALLILHAKALVIGGLLRLRRALVHLLGRHAGRASRGSSILEKKVWRCSIAIGEGN